MAWFYNGKLNRHAAWMSKNLVMIFLLAGILPHSRALAIDRSEDAAFDWQQTAVFSAKSNVQALAINADESVMAMAVYAQPGVQVQLYDIPSKTLLGSIETTVGKNIALRFAPSRDLLLVAGSRAFALWEVSLAHLHSNKALPQRFLRWRMPLRKADGLVGSTAFTAHSNMVVWSQKNKLYRRTTQRLKSDASKQLLYETNTGHITNVSPGFDSKMSGMLVQSADEKRLVHVAIRTNTPAMQLSAHRFPVLAAWFGTRDRLSLDSSFTLIRWKKELTPEPAKVLSGVVKNFVPSQLQPIAKNGMVMIGKSVRSQGKIVFVNQAGHAQTKGIHADSASLLAISPSSNYVLRGREKKVHLLLLNQRFHPLRYTHQLRSLDAVSMARSYVRNLSKNIASDTQKKQWLITLQTAKTTSSLPALKQALRIYLTEGNLSAAKKTAMAILQLRANQPAAVAALREIQLRQEKALLAKAVYLTKIGKPRQALELLTQKLAVDSLLPEQVKKEIARAEAEITQNLTLQQVQEKIQLGDNVAAKAMLREILARDAQNQHALVLQNQLRQQKRRGWYDRLALVIGTLLALLLAGGGYYARMRRKRSVSKEVQSDTELPKSPKNLAKRPAKTFFSRVAPKIDPIRIQVAHNLLESLRTKVLQNLQRGSVQSRMRATWLQWQAELNMLGGALGHQPGKIDQIEQQLKVIEQRIQQASTITASSPQQKDTVTTSTQRPQRGRPAQVPKPTQQTSNHSREEKENQWEPHQSTAAAPQPSKKMAKVAKRTLQNTPIEALNHYEVLQVGFKAMPDEVKRAYHHLLKQYHPDRHTGTKYAWIHEEAERVSRKVTEAYQVLMDEKKRADYDLTLYQKGVPLRR